LASGESVLATPARLPYADGAFSTIACHGALEFVRDDVGLIEEMGRILQPGGRLRLLVPAAGPLAVIDAYNLQRYLSDTARRGARPPETAEIGWRRHYGPGDLEPMLAGAGMRLLNARRRGLFFGELVHIAAMVLFRWLTRCETRYERGAAIAAMLARFEQRFATPSGLVLEVRAERHSSATT
jgi:SAM-dependent methyltransferase